MRDLTRERECWAHSAAGGAPEEKIGQGQSGNVILPVFFPALAFERVRHIRFPAVPPFIFWRAVEHGRVRGMVSDDCEAEFPEQFRSYSENDKHWQARRAFIVRNYPPGDGEALSPLRVDQLLSLSMVWANHIFMGCSYNKDLLEKVTEMAEGIEVEDAPHFTTRDEIMKKNQH
ncbi:CDKN2A interacting protein N-terminal like [Podarcis lilfordi]|uniref:CDKN2A interacting protein N-terminal like n=2 Tax=Podarcis TaxID=42163 RepID=A0AA35JXP6_9SAUR|nr:CDKN2A interacting protein N-terminal like [Podarcis lilfordi]